MGLLGDSFDDPQTQAVMQLAAGLLGPGSFGQALGRGLSGFQGSQESTAKQKYVGAQTADAMSQVALRNLQALQAQRMFDLQTPFLEEALRRMRAQQGQQPTQATGGQPSLMAGAGSQPSFMSSNQTMGGSAPQPAAQGASQQQVFPGIPDDVAFSTIGAGGFAKLPELIAKYNEPTEISKLLTALGIDPQSPQGQALLQKAAKKATNIPLQAGRAGAPMYDSDGNVVAMAPKIPDNAIPAVSGGRVTGVAPLPGASDIVQSNAAAAAGGKAQFTPFNGYTDTGKPAPLTSVATALGAPNAAPASRPALVSSDFPKIEGGNATDAAAQLESFANKPGTDAYSRQVALQQAQQLRSGSGAPLYGTQPPGTEANAKNNANEISKKWQAQVEANQQAQTTNSYLDSIEQMSKTAVAGPFSDRIAFANALLAPFSAESANALTAKQLLDKYHSQIVARLGQGGLATDAARAIIDAAYPNSHMTPEAIAEAAANLRGANNMIQTRTRLLQPIAADRSPEANGKYDALATQFDQEADPRIFQLKNMSADAAKKYLSAMPPQVQADLRSRAAKLKAMGAL